jgi:hypothetical protein
MLGVVGFQLVSALPAKVSASDHRHCGAKAALQLAGEGMGAGHGHIAELLDRLAAAADGLGDALVAMGT